MFSTKLTGLLGCRYPIVGGAMMDLSRAPLVAAICEAGALGVLASAIYQDETDFRNDLKYLRDHTDQPAAVNINLFPMMRKLDNFRYLEIMKEEGIGIVETSGYSPPDDLVARIRNYGLVWMHKCVGVRYAKKAAKMKADAVTVVGYENGGATGNLNVTTLVLVPSTVQAVDIPVIGGGGVVNGRTFLAVMALGAAGAIIGTRLMFSEECPLHRGLKEALLNATELDTDVIMRSVGFAHRIWMNEPAKKIAELEARHAEIAEIYPYASGEAARRMFASGELQAGTISCSQAVGLIKKIMPLKDIMAELMAEAAATHRALSG